MLGERRAAGDLGLAAPTSMRRARMAVVALVALAASVLAACGDAGGTGDAGGNAPAAEGALSGLVRTPTPTIALDAVPDIDGRPFEFRAEPGHLQLVYFGYLSCPDVCPTTFADLGAALAELGPGAADVDVAMVTVDPDRDVGENMRSYLDHFVTGGRGLRITDADRLRTVADAFGASYSVQDVDGVVEVSHSAFLYVLDTAGRLLVQWPFGTPAADIARDLRRLGAGATATTAEHAAAPAAAATATGAPSKEAQR